MRVDLFDFHLPEGHIADRPLEPRDAAKMLVVPAHAPLQDSRVRHLPEFLQPGDILITNDTKVIPARLFGTRGAARVEILLHRQCQPMHWEAFAKPAKRLRVGDIWSVADDFTATVTGKTEQGLVQLHFHGDESHFWNAIERYGSMPLPPYIQRQADDEDKHDYQTLFATKPGAVAAPTASLHFTPQLLQALEERGVQRATVTLHVGAGTFLPVKAEDTSGHHMHAEIYEIPQSTVEAIQAAKSRGGRVVAVGTTTMRTLEGCIAEHGSLKACSGETRLFITPGFTFHMVDILMTNFHLPKSTLFMLVSAFSGLDVMQQAYQHAIAQNYRFFSYGDACLLFRHNL